MKVITKEHFNNVTQQKETEIYVQTDKELLFVGRSTDVTKTFELIAIVNKWIEEQK